MSATGERRRWGRAAYPALALGGLALSLLSIPPLNWLLHGTLPLWLHAPLAALNLAVLSLGGLGSGVAFWHWQMDRNR